jgi:hypothetical protein
MHKPSAQSLGLVQAMSLNGVPQSDIAAAMRIDPKTLRKCYRQALDHGTILLCARVARNLGKIATTGRGSAAVSAARYILSCRAGWRDASRIEIDPDPGGFAPGQSPREIVSKMLSELARRNEEIEIERGSFN